MNSSRRLLNFIRAAMLLAIALYVFMGESIASAANRESDPLMFKVLALVSIVTVATILMVRRTTIRAANGTLQSQPEDPQALGRWRSGYIITYALCEAVALFGFVLRIMGFSLSQVAPF
ncbi:MAG TPA: hypothetical protein VGF08_13240, partial [Terriglobales bacterium]